MSEIQQITDYSYNLELLLEQYKNSENLKGMIDSMNDQADDLEEALFEIRNLFYVDTAEGVQLDVIGSIYGVERDGLSDSEFRTLIKAKASLVTSGEPESIINILKTLFGGTYVSYIPAYPAVPAAYYVLTDAIITVPELEIFSPAGVQPYIAGYLLDAQDNFIVDANGNKILHVLNP